MTQLSNHNGGHLKQIKANSAPVRDDNLNNFSLPIVYVHYHHLSSKQVVKVMQAEADNQKDH